MLLTILPLLHITSPCLLYFITGSLGPLNPLHLLCRERRRPKLDSDDEACKGNMFQAHIYVGGALKQKAGYRRVPTEQICVVG